VILTSDSKVKSCESGHSGKARGYTDTNVFHFREDRKANMFPVVKSVVSKPLHLVDTDLTVHVPGTEVCNVTYYLMSTVT
jgi:hypothetical protein